MTRKDVHRKKTRIENPRGWTYEEGPDGLMIRSPIPDSQTLTRGDRTLLFRQIRNKATKPYILVFGWMSDCESLSDGRVRIAIETLSDLQKDFLRDDISARTEGRLIFRQELMDTLTRKTHDGSSWAFLSSVEKPPRTGYGVSLDCCHSRLERESLSGSKRDPAFASSRHPRGCGTGGGSVMTTTSCHPAQDAGSLSEIRKGSPTESGMTVWGVRG